MDLEPLIQRAELHAGQFFAELRRMEQALVQASRGTDQVSRNAAVMSRNLSTAFRSPLAAVTSFRTAVLGLGSALGVAQVVRYADSFRQIQNSLRVAGVETDSMAAATEELFDVAIRARVPVQALAEMYQRTSVAGQEFGITQEELARSSELAAKAVTVAGSSTAAADGALRQYGQAVGSARVELEEFRSIQDGALPILQAVARGMEEAGGSVNKLRNLIKEGQVSGEGFFRAFLAGSDGIEEAFAKTESTVGQAFTNMRTAFTELVGTTDQSVGGTNRLAEAINDLAGAMRDPVFQTFARDMATEIAAGMASSVREITRLVEAARELGAFFDFGDQFQAQVDQASAAAEAMQRIPEVQAEIAQLINELAASDPGPDIVRSTMDRVAALRAEEAQLEGVVEQYREMAATAATVPMPTTGVAEPELRLMQQEASARGPLVQRSPISAKDFPVAGGAGAGTKTTFQDIIGPMQDRLALLRDTELSEDRIGEIISAQVRLKRDLSAAERAALSEINVAIDLEQDRRAQIERQTEQIEDMVSGLSDQAEESRLLASYGGQQTEHYQVHLALLQARLEIGRDLTAQEARLVDLAAQSAAQAERRAQTASTVTSLRQRRERAEFESGRALEAGTADIFGIPPSQEFFAEQERFRQRQAGATPTEIASMEPMIEDMARAERHLVLMNETAPELAGTLADIGQIAVFDGLAEAGERFSQMLVEMMFQAVALQLVMATLGAFGVGAPAAHTTGAGGAGFSLPVFGGPRQHGGRVRRGDAYLVGEAGPEMFVPDTGGRVAPGRMAAGAGGAPGITVNVNNTAQNAQVTASRPRMGVDVRPIVDVMVSDSLDRMHSGGQLDRMLGGRRTGVRRS